MRRKGFNETSSIFDCNDNENESGQEETTGNILHLDRVNERERGYR